ncbi:hypothetical protein ACM6RN_07025, partial [Trueperella pyogenes]
MKKGINPTNETDCALLARNAGFSDVATMGQLLGLSSEYSRIRLIGQNVLLGLVGFVPGSTVVEVGPVDCGAPAFDFLLGLSAVV